jgi:hypothetical protein
MVVRLFYCGVLLAILVMAIKMPDDFGAGQRNRAVFFMLTFGLLPLFNALFDFLSAGLTRYLLRLGLEQKRAVWRAILDGLGGIAIFFALGCSLITFVTFVTPADGGPLVDLAQLFANLRTAPGDYIWLDDDAIFHPLAHPSASIAGAAHPGAALSRMLAQFCGRSFGKRCTEPAGELPLWRLYLRYDHLRLLGPDLDHRSGHHP